MIFKNKKLLLVLLPVSLLSILAIFWMISKTNQTTKTENFPASTIKPVYEGSFGDLITTEVNTTQFPDKLPLLEISHQKLEDQYVYDIASKLGFSGTPKSTKDVNKGNVLYWTNQTASVFFFPETATIEYNSSLPYDQAVGKPLSDVALVDTAKKFLTENNFLKEDEIGQTEIAYLVKSSQYQGFEPGTKDDALVYKIAFTPRKANYEIVTPNAGEQTVTVSTLADGTVWSAKIVKFTILGNPTEEVRIKKYERVIADFAEQAILMGITNAQILLNDLAKDDIQKTTITSVKLAYLQGSPKSTLLYPIFLITGVSEVTGHPQKVKTIFYMYAEDK